MDIVYLIGLKFFVDLQLSKKKRVKIYQIKLMVIKQTEFKDERFTIKEYRVSNKIKRKPESVNCPKLNGLKYFKIRFFIARTKVYPF